MLKYLYSTVENLLITFMIAHYRGKIAAVRAECMAQKT